MTGRRRELAPFRRPRLLLFTLAAVLAYGAVEAIIIHSVAALRGARVRTGDRFLWAGISGLLTLPGRLVLPSAFPAVPGDNTARRRDRHDRGLGGADD